MKRAALTTVLVALAFVVGYFVGHTDLPSADQRAPLAAPAQVDQATRSMPDLSAPVITATPRPTATRKPATARNYVLNLNSYVFHLPTCASVKQMSPHNRRDFYGTREEVIAKGFHACGRCHP